jgi:hypothetical protein
MAFRPGSRVGHFGLTSIGTRQQPPAQSASCSGRPGACETTHWAQRWDESLDVDNTCERCRTSRVGVRPAWWRTIVAGQAVDQVGLQLLQKVELQGQCLP